METACTGLEQADAGLLAEMRAFVDGRDCADVLKSSFYARLEQRQDELDEAELTALTSDAGQKTPEELDFIVPHQANTRIIDFAAKKLNLPAEKFIVTIQNYGNTAAASVPTALDEANRSGRIRRGDLVAMVAFGGGLSSAGAVVRW